MHCDMLPFEPYFGVFHTSEHEGVAPQETLLPSPSHHLPWLPMSQAWVRTHVIKIQGYLQKFPTPEAFDAMIAELDLVLPKDMTSCGDYHQAIQEELILDKLFKEHS